MVEKSGGILNRLEKFDKQHSLRVATLLGLGFGITPIILSINRPELFWPVCAAEVVVAGIHLRSSFKKREELLNSLNKNTGNN